MATNNAKNLQHMAPKQSIRIANIEPGMYECEDVWKIDTSYIALLRPTVIVSKHLDQRMVESVPQTPHWTLVDLGQKALLPGRDAKLVTFSGLVEVKVEKGKKTISVYKPFLGNN